MKQQIKTLCIPRIKQDYTKKFIRNTVNKCKFGEIQSIVERPLRNEKNYKKVIIRLMVDKYSKNGIYLLYNTDNGIPLKIVYNDYEYWRLISVDL